VRFDEYDAHDATGLAALVRRGEVTADELLDLALARAADTDEAIAAVVHVQEPVARAAIAAGLPDGAFRGVPFLLKDLGCEAIDFPTSMGSRLYEGYRYTYDSELFVRMQRTGLVAFGRTTSPEFGVGPTTEAAVYGRPTRNPWHRDHVAGGSSGGSGASVAAGVVPMAHGSDGGGSVRIPAASCGLFGLKPTRAMLPDGPAAGEGWAGMAIDGFLTRSVRDTAAMLDATVGTDLGAPYFAPPLQGSFLDAITTPPRRLRIAVTYTAFDGAQVHHDCVAAVRHTAELLDSLGHEVVEHTSAVLPTAEVEAFVTAWSQIVACGSQLTVRQRATALGRTTDHPDVQSRIERVTRLACDYATSVSGADYLAAIDVVHALGRRMARFLEPYDMLLTTTLGEPPARIGRFGTQRVDAWNSFLDYRLQHVLPYSPISALANGTGQPAMSLPLWWNAESLPVGTHLMGRTGDDLVLLQLAAQLEQASPWFHRRPAL
jgi:amidase/6-aminohexanoate-cyclic-dimer hydrolase